MKEIPTPLTDNAMRQMMCFKDHAAVQCLTDLARQLERDRAELLDWLRRHYAAEEGPGETDRPQFIELRALLERMK